MQEKNQKERLADLTLLGNKEVQYQTNYAPEILESVDNNHPNRDYFIKYS